MSLFYTIECDIDVFLLNASRTMFLGIVFFSFLNSVFLGINLSIENMFFVLGSV